MFSFSNIYKAYISCRKNKRNTLNQLEFEADLLTNLWDLQDDLLKKNYRIGKSLCFLTSSPKLREIFAADFRDRIVHHILVKELEVLYEPRFIHDVYNNRKEIGNLASQFFANLYMNDFDNYVKRVLKVKYYIRYVDDFVLFDTSRERLQSLYADIESYLKDKLDLELRSDTKLKRHSQGLDFLGYIIREDYTLVRKRVIHNYKQKKAQYLDNYEKQKGKMKLAEIKDFLSVQASFASHTKHANSYNLMNKVGVLNESNPFNDART